VVVNATQGGNTPLPSPRRAEPLERPARIHADAGRLAN